MKRLLLMSTRLLECTVSLPRPSLLAVILLLLVTPLMIGFMPPRQGGDAGSLQLQIEAGYSQRFRPDYWTPLRLTIANDGPDISGSLRVRPENNAGISATTYLLPIDLPRQSRKQVFLNVVLNAYARQVLVELVNEGGDVLATASSPLTPADPDDVLVAVITDAPGGSVDLSAMTLGSGSTAQSNWSAENLPPLADALLAVDVMLFTDVDTGRLSVEQRRAVHDWVTAGGHLIVTGGPNYQLTTAALADLLPVTIAGTTTTDDLTALAVYAGRYSDTLQGPDVIMTTGALQPGAETRVEVDGRPLLTRWTYGGGLVDYLAVDPGLAPLRRWNGSSALWEALVFTPRQAASWTGGFQDWVAANMAVRQSPGFDLPSTLQMMGMLALYILCIGPLNYLFLRVIGRRELAWVTIPLTVLIFTILAYYTGFSLRGTQATLNRLAVVQVWPDRDRARIDGLVGVLSPRRAVYQVIAPAGLTLRPLPEASMGGLGFNPVQRTTTIEESSLYTAPGVLVDASLIAGFVTTGFVQDPPRLTSDVTLTYAADAPPRLAGAITNTTGQTLEKATLLVPGGVAHLGTLAPGENVAFDMLLTGTRSAPLSLVNGSENDLLTGNLNLTTQDVMGASFMPMTYFYYDSANGRDRVARQRQDLLGSVAFDLDFSGGRGDRAYLFGWAASSPLAVTLGGESWVAEDTALFIFELPLALEHGTEPLTISPGLTVWVSTGDTTTASPSPYNLTLGGADQAGFRFMMLPSARLAAVSWLELTARRSGLNTASVFLWDWGAADWEALDLSIAMRVRVEEPARFLGPDGAVQVLIVPDNPNDYVSYDQVDVTWHGTF